MYFLVKPFLALLTIGGLGISVYFSHKYLNYKKSSSKAIEKGITKNTKGNAVNSDVVASLPEVEIKASPTVQQGTTPAITQTPT